MTDRIHVLHLDDNERFLDVVSTFLEADNDDIDVTSETEAEAALDRLDGPERIDCVVSDYRMGPTDGVDFLRSVRERDPRLPFILYTGKGSEEVASEAITQGVTDYLQKKHTDQQYDLLANRIRNAVDRTRAERHLAEREQMLTGLHEGLRSLMRAATREEIADLAVDIADDVIGLPWIAVYLLDESAGVLRPVSYVADVKGFDDEPPTFIGGESLAWDAFVDGEARRHEDVQAHETVYTGETNLNSELSVPLGDHGVLLAGTTDDAELDDATAEFVEILGANGKAALDRAEREATLRERDRELERQNTQLKRLNRINTVIRDIDQALVKASTRAEIEQEVCERLVDIDPYAFAWIGGYSDINETIRPRAKGGDEQQYLGNINLDGTDNPVQQTLQDAETQVVQNIFEDDRIGSWRKEALKCGFRSVATVPLVYEGAVYGVLQIYADRLDTFDEETESVLSELGETIGYAINAIDRKEALMTDSVVQVEFRVPDADDFLYDLSADTASNVDLRTILPQSDGSHLIFYSIADTDPDDVIEFAESASGVSDARLISKRNGTALFECRTANDTIATTVADHGGVPRTVRADPNGGRVVVDLPEVAEVRSFAERITSAYPSVEFVARRERTSAARSKRSFREQLDDHLTDRQREVLEAAYFSGYFEWPREKTGEEIAEALGVAPPTFNQHLRAGERKLFETLFEPDAHDKA
ncbi:Predicted DNA binding protein, contains HTH domain [Natronoarchaeum philippinense]|uniref:Predicted DNA binding protein, contains HTH domain n=1 Tax=Natronoarchaeum philippinense TaxID=558529 RepID=A0A285N807_NATPI|nr:bacterio-opsin activator domain-containing protein [Natronoarchaeum philippinense]SNZ05624.1 Predicted DNA binding protein, contains HTH domain [Natronoarchaeum philippinense]